LVVGAIVTSKGKVKVRAPVSGTIQILEAEFGERVGRGWEMSNLADYSNCEPDACSGENGFSLILILLSASQ